MAPERPERNRAPRSPARSRQTSPTFSGCAGVHHGDPRAHSSKRRRVRKFPIEQPVAPAPPILKVRTKRFCPEEGLRRAPAIGRIFGTALRAWWDDDAPRLGASLACYTLFAIAPILIVATAVAGMAFGAEAVRGEIIDQLDQLIGREGARAVQSLLEGASQRRAGVVATVLGGITFVV